LVENDPDFVSQEFLQEDTMMNILYVFLNIITLGAYYLFVKWYPHLKLKFYVRTDNIK